MNAFAELLETIANAPVKKRAITNYDVLNEAHAYTKPSSFSRGMRIDLNGLTILLISGTASIDEHGVSVHVGDFRAQMRRTLANISGLLASEGARGTTSCALPAICATSSATTMHSTKSVRSSSKSRDLTRCPRPPASRRSCAGRSCLWKLRRLPCFARKSLRAARSN